MTRRSAPELFRIRVRPVSVNEHTLAMPENRSPSAAARLAELGSAGRPGHPLDMSSTHRADAPHAAHALPTGPAPRSRQACLQLWLQLSAFTAVRPCPPSFTCAGQVAH